jgi:hypothetical protein
MTKRILGLLIIAVFMASTVRAQQKEALTPRIYEIKNRDAESIAKLLLGMDVELVVGSINKTFNTFTVRANEQGHAMVADLVRKYDIPKKTMEFQFFLIRAKTSGEALKDGLPEKVQKVIKEISALTRYKSFEVIDSPFVRAQEGMFTSLDGKGIYDYSLVFSVNSEAPIGSTEDKRRQIRISRFEIAFSSSKAKDPLQSPVKNPFQSNSGKSNSLQTSFNIAEGETIVIGASQSESEGQESNTAVITIVTAKIL